MVDVLGIGEDVGGSDDMAEDLFRGGNGGGSGEMVDEIGEEEWLGGELQDFFGVLLIVCRAGLSAGGG